MVINAETIKNHVRIDTASLVGEYDIIQTISTIYSFGNGITVAVEYFTPTESMVIPFCQKPLSCLEFIYTLSADVIYSIMTRQGTREQIAIESKMRTMFYNTETHGICEVGTSVPVRVLYIYITPEKLLSFIGEENNLKAKKRLFHIYNKECGYAQTGYMTPVVEMIVYQICHCNIDPIARKTFIEGKTLELLAYEIEYLFGKPRESASFHPDDVVLIHAARDVMMQNMLSPPTVDELARKVGLNRKKIKTGFRILYNTTVFGFLRQYRMEQARLMFERDLTNVSEVACSVGYTNVSHFSVAFRNQFGILPGKYLKIRKSRCLQVATT